VGRNRLSKDIAINIGRLDINTLMRGERGTKREFQYITQITEGRWKPNKEGTMNTWIIVLSVIGAWFTASVVVMALFLFCRMIFFKFYVRLDV